MKRAHDDPAYDAEMKRQKDNQLAVVARINQARLTYHETEQVFFEPLSFKGLEDSRGDLDHLRVFKHEPAPSVKSQTQGKEGVLCYGCLASQDGYKKPCLWDQNDGFCRYIERQVWASKVAHKQKNKHFSCNYAQRLAMTLAIEMYEDVTGDHHHERYPKCVLDKISASRIYERGNDDWMEPSITNCRPAHQVASEDSDSESN